MPRAKSLTLWVLYALPLGYASAVLLTIFHEIVGHGLTAELWGGVFLRFQVFPSAGGLAWTDGPPGSRGPILLGGIVWTIALGLLAAGLTRFVRGPKRRMAGIVLATTLLHDSFAYGFWSAVSGPNTGDTYRYLQLVDSAWIERLIVIGSFLGLLVTTDLSTRAIVRCLEDDLGPLDARLALVVGTALVGLMLGGYLAVGSFSSVGIEGNLPGYVATLAQLAACVVVFRRRRREVEVIGGSFKRVLPVAWAAAGGLFALTYFWLRHVVVITERNPFSTW